MRRCGESLFYSVSYYSIGAPWNVPSHDPCTAIASERFYFRGCSWWISERLEDMESVSLEKLEYQLLYSTKAQSISQAPSQAGRQTVCRCSVIIFSLLQDRGDLRGRVPDCCSGAALVHPNTRKAASLPSIVSSLPPKAASVRPASSSPRQELLGPVSAKSEMSLAAQNVHPEKQISLSG